MSFRPADVLAVGSLGIRMRKLRAVLTAIGIAIGITAIVAVLGVGASSRADLISRLDGLGTNLLRVSPGMSMFGDETTLPDDARAMIERIGPVQQAAGTTAVPATVHRTGYIPELETGGISVRAADAGLLDTLEGSVAAGRFIGEGEGSLPSVVLGAVAAERLGIRSLDGSPMVLIGGNWFVVVGLLDPVPLAPEIDSAALVGYGVAADVFDTSRSPGTVYLRTDPAHVAAVMEVLARTAKPLAPDEVDVIRPSDALSAREAVDTTFTALLAALGAVALLVAGVGIANVMVISVLERRTEIGLRRAMGAGRLAVSLPFVVEATLVSATGGVLGVVLGAAVTAGYASANGWVVDVPVAVAGLGVAAAMGVGAFAGVFPALRAARLDPAEALRPA